MAMKKEALTNLIADDLAKRNENWTEIDTTFALKADKSTTYTKTEVDTSLGLKANKQQEAWITPTLLNGWEAYSVSEPPRFMKDQMGFVRIKGQVKSGTGGEAIFMLPDGYRPSGSFRGLVRIAGGLSTYIDITQSGQIVVGVTSALVSLDNISFKWEA